MNNIIGKKILMDLIFVLLFMVVTYSIFSEIDMFESLTDYVESHESWELDELILTILLTPFVFVWFVIRRWKDGNLYWQRAVEREREFAHKLKFDELSNLPNASYFEVLVSKELQSLAENRIATMIVIEVCNYELAQEGLSDQEMVQFVETISRIIQKSVNHNDLTGRLGKELFAISFSSNSEAESGQRIQEIEKKLAIPSYFLISGIEFKAGVASIVGSEKTVSANTLIHRAFTAIDSGDIASDNTFLFYSERNDQNRRDVIAQKAELREAIRAGEMKLFLQPQVDATTNTVTGAEALIRWQHPKNGLVLPYMFIHLAQKNPLATEMGEWAINDALKIVTEFNNRLCVSVNIFPQHIQSPEFSDRLGELLAQNPKSVPDKLKLEITELGTIADYDVVTENLNKCRELGVRLSLDDFGTGHSSLNQLRVLPVDEIKLDRSFVSDFLTNPIDNKMVRSVLSLAGAFNLDVISEGIETPEQRDALVSLGATLQQGYFYSKPLPKEEFVRWLDKQSEEDAIKAFS